MLLEIVEVGAVVVCLNFTPAKVIVSSLATGAINCPTVLSLRFRMSDRPFTEVSFNTS